MENKENDDRIINKKKYLLKFKEKILSKSLVILNGQTQKVNVEDFSKSLVYISSFITDAIELSRLLEIIWRGASNRKTDERNEQQDKQEISESQEIVSKLIRKYKFDNISTKMCKEILSRIEDVENILIYNENEIKQTFLINYEENNQKFFPCTTKKEHCIDYFEILWITLLHYKFFLIWYFIVYREILNKFMLKSKESVSLSVNQNQSKVFLALEKKSLAKRNKIDKQFDRLSRKRIHRKQSDQLSDSDNNEELFIETNFSRIFRVLIGYKNIPQNLSQSNDREFLLDSYNYLEKNNNMFLMSFKDYMLMVDRLTINFSTQRFTMGMSDLISAMEFKASMFIVLGQQNPDNEDPILLTNRDIKKERVSPARIKVLANFFNKYRKGFLNSKLFAFAPIKIYENIFSNRPVIKRRLPANNFHAQEHQDSQYFIKSTLVTFDSDSKKLRELRKRNKENHFNYLYLIGLRMRELLTNLKDDYVINIAKMIPDRTLAKLIGLEEQVYSYYYLKIVQEKSGVLNAIKKKMKNPVKEQQDNIFETVSNGDTELKSSAPNSNQNKRKKMPNATKNNSNTKRVKTEENLNMVESLSEIEEDLCNETIKTENIEFVYNPNVTAQKFLDVVQTRNERERFFFEKLLFKMNQSDMIFYLPEHQQRELINDLLMLDAFFTKIKPSVKIFGKEDLQEDSIIDYFYADLNVLPVNSPHFSKIVKNKYPIITKRMSRYDVLYYVIKEENGEIIILENKNSVLYKCGDLFSALSLWVFLMLKYIDEDDETVVEHDFSENKDIIVDVDKIAELFINFDIDNI